MVSASQRFTLELIAEALHGSAGTAFARQTPAIGLRLLDLSPAVIEAQDGQAFGTSQSSRVSFRGRGKALVFELPEAMLLEESQQPLPLWLMALAKESKVSEVPGSAVLLASACVDLRQEVEWALASLKKGVRSAPINSFRRCSFRMTAVRDASCSLRLDCFLRLYAGSPQPLTGNELLETITVASAASFEDSGEGAWDGAAASKSCRTAETQTEVPLAVEAAISSAAQVLPPAAVPPPVIPTPGVPAQRQTFKAPIKRGGTQAVEDAFFANEIHLKSAPDERPDAVGKTVSNEVPPPPPQEPWPSQSGLAADAPSSLPLVSELLRELWQIRGMTHCEER
eukprot:TRINITY_DN29802_c0_g1_i1.p1 TRINITY_DN29802_c0_g1~~TRINITY_DN29802_c0_g1_i1.p1  ORF type:complete len:340 (-),score=71.00 TRINITY_DN29802_c0_g1_i1:19-1038(-)